MNILAINTSGERVELALRINEKNECYVNDIKEMASVVLLNEIDSLLDRFGISLDDIDLFGCVIGPGSFTGIRIGVCTIRAFCHALKKQVVAVNRLQLLAYINKSQSNKAVVVDGNNGVSYVAIYSEDGQKTILQPSCHLTSQLNRLLDGYKIPLCVISDSDLSIDGYTVQNQPISAKQLIDYVVFLQRERGSADYTTLEPLYIRKAQAEREAGEL